MIPLLEFALINHPAPINVRNVQINNAMRMIAIRNIKKHEPLVQQTVIAPQLDVFINSGKVVENNDMRNTAMITVGIDPSDKLFDLKLELLESPKNEKNFLMSRHFTIEQCF